MRRLTVSRQTTDSRKPTFHFTYLGFVVQQAAQQTCNKSKACSKSSSAVGWKVGEAESCSYPTDSYTFPTEDIMGSQSFNSAPKIPENGVLLAPNFVFLDKNFPTKRKFSDRLQFREGKLPPRPLPRRHWPNPQHLDRPSCCTACCTFNKSDHKPDAVESGLNLHGGPWT